MILTRLRRAPPGLRAVALYMVAIVCTKAISLLMLPVTTASLPPAEFARLELLLSAAEVGMLLAGAGLVQTLYRFGAAAGEEGRRAAAEVAGLTVTIALLGCTAAVTLAIPLSRLFPMPVSGVEVALLGILVAVEAAVDIPLTWFRMQGRATHFAAVVVGRTLLQATLMATLLLAGYGVTGIMLAAAAAATLTAAGLTVSQARNTGLRLAPKAWGGLLVYGMPLIGGGFASFVLGTADRWFLVGAVTPETLAHYALAAKLAAVTVVFVQPFDLWWSAQRLQVLAASGGAERTAQVVGTGAALTVLACATMALAGPLLIAVATPPAYHAAGAYMPWLVAAVGLQVMSHLVDVGCYLGRTGARPLALNSLAAAVALLGYVLLIPRWGVEGAIAATLAAQAVRFAAFHHVSRRHAPIAYPLCRIGLMAAAAASASVLPQILPPGPTVAAGLVALAALTALGLALRLLPSPGRMAQRMAASA